MDSVFQEIYQKYHQDLYQFIFYMVKDRDLAEDLVQEVYLRVLKSYRFFEGKSSEKTWLFSIAKNVSIDYFRKQKRWRLRIAEELDWKGRDYSDPKPLPEELTVLKEEIQQLYRCLDECSQDQKMVVIMRYLNHLNIQETAEALEWTESKVKTTQHRALLVLKRLMNQKERKGEVNYG
ncbi:RNA polymerase sigma factor SigX [Heyndrickxia acidicola]|uniref:RNA polymerase sigma factor n=2 Tax=Heyndrickxia acidicola TaxID=209389 RepID=A0ABU6MPE5_9BACI|nr:RNA polymerase sigma factor SigX [Heyndrickxia acidicola]MED1204915.1 RNA polymerase sigma factor SigX [Heyndrickxia acidicola]